MKEEAVHTRTQPVLLMVSGGSDSMALLELVVRYVRRSELDVGFAEALSISLPDPGVFDLSVLHVNHMLRGAQADEDEQFVRARCEQLGVPFTAERVDVASRAREEGCGIEATARAVRYELAAKRLDVLCERACVDASKGIICTAHTLDDRIETFYMRSLVGTGPGGLASIPRARGRIRRPLLDCTREQLRDFLRAQSPGMPDSSLWRDDPTNDDGSNFRSQVRTHLMPVLRELRPGFEPVLARTMDLIAEEDAALDSEAKSIVYRNLRWDDAQASMPRAALERLSRPLARRVLRCCLLAVVPDARIEAAQIDRILDGMCTEGFATDVSGPIRVRISDDHLILQALV